MQLLSALFSVHIHLLVISDPCAVVLQSENREETFLYELYTLAIDRSKCLNTLDNVLDLAIYRFKRYVDGPERASPFSEPKVK